MIRKTKLQRQLASTVEQSIWCYLNDDAVILHLRNPKQDGRDVQLRLDRDQALALGINLIVCAGEEER